MSLDQKCFSYLRLQLLLALLVVLSACSGITRHPVPLEDHLEVSVLGRQDLRFWGDKAPVPKWAEILKENPDKELIAETFPAITRTEHNYLAISGGGANGAYGAGLLVGWTEAGTRPEFTMVTGVSTGALIAPFAFLGPAYDEQLKQLYTNMNSDGIFRMHSLLRFFQLDGMADSSPFEQQLQKYVTEEFVARIAEQHRLGRSLLICTTNLDAERPVIWNIGRIADSGKPGAVKLIRQVLQASASVPGVFPPVYIEVKTADGEVYDEMHVDGGTSAQMFLYPVDVDWAKLIDVLQVKGRPTAYLIRNSYIHAEYEPVDPRVMPIVKKTMDSLVRTQGIGDAFRIYTLAKRDGVEVKLTSIPQGSVSVEPDETFDPDYMSALFDYGYERGLAQDAWIDVEQAIEGD